MNSEPRFRHALRLAFVAGSYVLGLWPASLRAGGEGDGLIPPARYASLPSEESIADPAFTGSLPDTKTLSGFASLVSLGTITLRDSTPTNCIPGDLRDILASVAQKFGPVSIESTHRSKGTNWRAGGARHSLHLSCRAVDFRVRTRVRGVMAYLRAHPHVGGLKIYRNGIIHIDNGERRSW